MAKCEMIYVQIVDLEPWQIAQALACRCKGSDPACPCQTVQRGTPAITDGRAEAYRRAALHAVQPMRGCKVGPVCSSGACTCAQLVDAVIWAKP